MQEAFLHYVWKYKTFKLNNLKTVHDESVKIISSGDHNLLSGPDFFNAQLEIDNQLWAGNVEMHLKASDWYAHNHETDNAYDNVILHVVWEHDTDIYRKDNTAIPTLELKNYVHKETLNNYKKLSTKENKWIYCENEFRNVDDFVLNNWLERLFIERLERKSLEVEDLLKLSNNNWEAVLFMQLTKNFGLKVNGEAFLSLAKSIPWKVLQNTQSSSLQLEALLFGQAGLLEEDIQDGYFISLKSEYSYLKHKFNLTNTGVLPIQFFRLRPANFPTIRLAQLAALYHKQIQLFSKLITVKSTQDAYNLFEIEVSPFWKTHYNFTSSSKKSSKKFTKRFLDLVLINTVIPLHYTYAKYLGKEESDKLLYLASNIDPEQNSIITKFNSLKQIPNSALYSQALLQLKMEYCDKQKCLECAVGNSILKSK